MGLFRKLAGMFRRESNGGVARVPRTGAIPLFDSGAPSAMCVAAVYRCVKLLGESVANLPVQYLRSRGGIFADDTADHLHYLLNIQPDASVSAFGFWRQAVAQLLLDGNAYIVPCWAPDGTGIDRLVLCARGTVAHDTLNDTYTVRDSHNHLHGTFAESEMIHLRDLTGADPKHGVSVLTYAHLTTAIAATGDRETRSRFATGGNVRGIITNDRTIRGMGMYDDKELSGLAVDVDRRLNSEGQRIVSVPGEVDLKQLSLSSTDMQFLESRKFTVREICRFFGVHPSFVFDDTSNNYKSAEQANVAFLSHTLNPLLRCIENELTRKLVSPRLSARRMIRFDRRGLYASDLDGMMRYRTQLLQVGTTVNEVRRLENLPPVEGGDTVMVSANLRPVTDLTAATQPSHDSQNSHNSHDTQE